MNQRLLSLGVLVLWLVSIILGPLATAYARPAMAPSGDDAVDWSWVSPDLDGDGLPNWIETGGWCNATGCRTTDALKADSDRDGLTDAQEKLFDSNPQSAASPGIYAIYQDDFETAQYYPWQPYGHLWIARGDDFTPTRPDAFDVQYGHGTDLDAIVVRRGATFTVGGPLNETLEIAKSKSSLSNLSKEQDPLTGLWKVKAPANGTVGKYTLTLGAHSIDVYVIFELPEPGGGLTQAAIDSFLYDGDINNTRDDETVLVYDQRFPPDPGGPPYTIPVGEEIKQGISYRYDNQQFNRFLFEDYVMEAINGQDNPKSAIAALNARVDVETVFRNPHPRTASWNVLNPGINLRQQCSNISGLLSAFARSAGIPARAVVIDWRKSTFDHADEIWLNGDWYVYRGYKTFEMAEEPDDTHTGCGVSKWPGCGVYDDFTRSIWGRQRYPPWHSGGSGIGNVLVVADDDYAGTGLAYTWASWDVNRIRALTSRLVTQQSIYWKTFGWTKEPTISGGPFTWPALPPDPPGNLLAEPGNGNVRISWSAVSGASYYYVYVNSGNNVSKTNYSTRVKVTDTSKVIDALNNGQQYAFMVTAVGPTGESAVSVTIQASPNSSPPGVPSGVNAVPGDQQVSVSWNNVASAISYHVYYRQGSSVNKSDGIQVQNANSPHVVNALTNGQQYAFGVTAIGSGGESALSNVVTAIPQPPLLQMPQVDLGDVTAEYGEDSDGDGRYDRLVLELPVTVSQAGRYSFWAQLAASGSHPNLMYAGGIAAEALTHAELQAGTQIVKLVFDGRSIALSRAAGPYALSGVWVTQVEQPDPSDFVNDSLASRNDVYTTRAYGANDFDTYGALLSGAYTFDTVDSDGDGQLDAIEVTTPIAVEAPGAYTLKGSLFDARGKFMGSASWSGNDTQARLVFGDLAGSVGPYTLRNVDLLDDTTQSVDFVDEAYHLEPTESLSRANGVALSANTEEALDTRGSTITPTLAFSTAVVNGNLQLTAGVQVAVTGTYKLEALLLDGNDNIINWAVSQPATLAPGSRQLPLTFNGSVIRSHGMNGPYQIVALKVLAGGANYQVLDKVDVAYTTPAYARTQFTPLQETALFEDVLETGAAKWSAGGAWSLSQDAYFSAAHAWLASNANASLSLATPLNFSGVQKAALRFHTGYALASSGDTGYLEGSTDGSNWTILATFSTDQNWTTQIVDLGAYARRPKLYLRFRLEASGGSANDSWAIDDVLIAAEVHYRIALPIIR